MMVVIYYFSESSTVYDMLRAKKFLEFILTTYAKLEDEQTEIDRSKFKQILFLFHMEIIWLVLYFCPVMVRVHSELLDPFWLSNTRGISFDGYIKSRPVHNGLW